MLYLREEVGVSRSFHSHYLTTHINETVMLCNLNYMATCVDYLSIKQKKRERERFLQLLRPLQENWIRTGSSKHLTDPEPLPFSPASVRWIYQSVCLSVSVSLVTLFGGSHLAVPFPKEEKNRPLTKDNATTYVFPQGLVAVDASECSPSEGNWDNSKRD